MRLTIPSALAIAICAALVIAPVQAQNALDRTKVLHAAAYAHGMARWADIGGNARLPAVDIVNTMEFWGSGTIDRAGQPVKTEYHVALGFNPPAMRVEMTRPAAGGGAPQRTIQTVRDNFAWDESEMGAGLIPGKGTATPANAAVQERLLPLWTLPYGVLKAALAAGDKTTVSSEGGATIITAPLAGPLAGITVKATLDANSMITKVETMPANPALTALATQTDYSGYKDHGEILTDIKSPSRIVRKQGGRTILDVEVKSWDTSPYLVFPVPPNVKAAAASR